MTELPIMRTELGQMILEELQNTKVRWSYTGAKIRDEKGRCPVCSVIYQKNRKINEKHMAWRAASTFLGRPLTYKEEYDISLIVAAADVDYVWSGNHVRF